VTPLAVQLLVPLASAVHHLVLAVPVPPLTVQLAVHPLAVQLAVQLAVLLVKTAVEVRVLLLVVLLLVIGLLRPIVTLEVVRGVPPLQANAWLKPSLRVLV
jgi:hypothetical protein